MVKGKHISEKVKKESISQKWIVVLIITAVALVAMAAAIVSFTPDKPEPVKFSKNKTTSKIISMPPSTAPSRVPVPPDVKQETLDLQIDRAAVSPQSNEMNIPTPPHGIAAAGQDLEIKNSGGQDIPGPETYNPEFEHPDADDAEMNPPDTSDPEIEKPAADDTEMYRPDTSDPEIEKPTAAGPDLENIKSNDLEILNPNKEDTEAANPDPHHNASWNTVAKSSNRTSVDLSERPFTVQVGVFRVDVYAKRMADRLERLYYRSFIHEVMGKDRQPLYLVCYGRFKTRKEAAQAVIEFKEKEKMDAVVSYIEPR